MGRKAEPVLSCDKCPIKLKGIEAKVEEAERLISELSKLVAELKTSLEKKNG